MTAQPRVEPRASSQLLDIIQGLLTPKVLAGGRAEI